ncbi:flagellar basal-body rod protein FlgC [Sedimentibacter acidaminivorans]|jgi:flagellar basal-body rod protein FlgC|uniref:Flagellar basal-body rod protein FlgC n=1 Tax=Sedimentibacter acidaminivorans TaxID=913099 RepID=A0ABS4GDN0_9FIRM|nr:flagellar basal body rod protein FlgC [Sedimentibacter acidaminivorans]MBP1925757.1 flagellar basal-body rod protein FlgC [Sedimentibacter acidaminivorans]
MSFLQSLNISGSGLTAQKLRMDVISENIANIDSTRTETGGPYRRKMIVLSSTGDFKKMLVKNLNSSEINLGVEVTDIVEDQSDFKLVYNPEHPDADENGYVSMPNVDSLKETVDMMEAYRAYQANITALNTTKQMAVKALEIGR